MTSLTVVSSKWLIHCTEVLFKKYLTWPYRSSIKSNTGATFSDIVICSLTILSRHVTARNKTDKIYVSAEWSLLLVLFFTICQKSILYDGLSVLCSMSFLYLAQNALHLSHAELILWGTFSSLPHLTSLQITGTSLDQSSVLSPYIPELQSDLQVTEAVRCRLSRNHTFRFVQFNFHPCFSGVLPLV